MSGGRRAKPARAKGSIRPGALRVEVYNEGLCVYLWDEGHADRLRGMMRDRKKFRGASPDKTFYENLASPAFGKAAAAEGLAAVYGLEQDDEVTVEVVVGPDLTATELSVAYWLEPQRVRLSLPTGRFRVDTPNTMPLDPDDKEDPGGLVVVEPGDYVMSLYRVDWTEMQRRECRRRMPGEVIVLTPAAKAGKPKTEGPVLPFTPRRDSPPGRPRIKGGQAQFDCKVAFLGFWETYGVNITRASAAKPGLAPGSRLRFTVEKIVLDALFHGDISQQDFLRYYGKERLEKETAGFKEFAIGDWSKLLGVKESLRFSRVQAKKCIPERLHDQWVAAKGEVLSDRWEMPQPAELPPVTAKPSGVKGGVAFSSPEEVVLNIEPAHLDSMGAKPGELLKLSPSGARLRTVFYGATYDAKCQHTVVTSRLLPMHAAFFKRMREHGAAYQYYTLDGSGREPRFDGDLPTTALPAGEAWPVVGVISPTMNDPARLTLRLTPFGLNGDSAPSDWRDGLDAGNVVEIRPK